VRSALLLIALAGCPAKRTSVETNIATPSEGTALAVYITDGTAAFAVIDDRRIITVGKDGVLLDRIDPAAQLPTLVIEPLDGKPFRVQRCARERIDTTPTGLVQLAQPRPPVRPDAPDPQLPVPTLGVLSPLVRCLVEAPPGEHFVRVLHVAPIAGFRAHHDVTFSGPSGDQPSGDLVGAGNKAGYDGDAKLVSRYSFVTPAWSGRKASLSLFDGKPGREIAPREIARGSIVLDGTAAVFANAERTVPARTRVVYDGAVRDATVAHTELTWGRESRRQVHTVLELEGVELPFGVVDAHVTLDQKKRDVVVPVREREIIGKTLRLALWVEDALHGVRRNTTETYVRNNGKVIRQQFQLSVASSSDAPREVWIEERLRPLEKRTLINPPEGLVVEDHVARIKLEIPPKGTEQIDFAVAYDGL
jgi:hypothetical protein